MIFKYLEFWRCYWDNLLVWTIKHNLCQIVSGINEIYIDSLARIHLNKAKSKEGLKLDQSYGRVCNKRDFFLVIVAAKNENRIDLSFWLFCFEGNKHI